MKRAMYSGLVLCGAAALLPVAALAQPAILSNASTNPDLPSLASSATSASGVAAPVGFQWSELQSDAGGANALGGLAAHASTTAGSFRLADNFVVPVGQPWRIDAVSLYAYQSQAAANPFATVNLQIWSGRPGDAGSTVVFGNTTTNRLQSVTATSLYRVFNSVAAPAPMAPDTAKRIWELRVNTGQTSLGAGTYWLDWQITTSVAGTEAYAPTVTKSGLRTQAGYNARQMQTGAWTDALDKGKPATAADVAVDLPFVLYGYIGTPPCSSDFNGDGDIGTDADIEAFFRCLAGTCCATCGTADYNGDGDIGTDADIEAFFRVLAGNAC